MGFFDRIKKSLYKGTKIEEVNKDNGVYHYHADLSNGQTFDIESIIKKEILDHNGIKTQLCEAIAVNKEKEDDAFYFYGNQLRNILFEISEGANIDETILQKIVKLYEQETKNPDNDSQIFYVGYLNNNPSDLNIRKTVKGMESLDKRIREEEEIRAEREREAEAKNAQRERANEEARQQIYETARINHAIYEKERKSMIQERLNNPFLTPTINGYNGVNMKNGDILRMRYIDKVGKDKKGTYLYTARVDSTPSESDAEILDEELFGQPICFTTDKKIENILKEYNVEQLKNFLRLVSFDGEKQDRLIFMGDFSNGQISGKELKDLSGALKSTIEEKQREYRKDNNIDI